MHDITRSHNYFGYFCSIYALLPLRFLDDAL